MVSEAETGNGNVYLDRKNIVRRDRRLFFWLMFNTDIGSSNAYTVKELIVTDCKKPLSYESLTRKFYKGSMASGRYTGETSEDKGKIQYPVPLTLEGVAIQYTCGFYHKGLIY